MKDQLVFDVTDANTIADSDSVGAYLRSSDGTLLTHTTDGSREALDVYTELGQAEDSAHSSGDIGAMFLAVRNDTEGSLVDTDGDYAPLQVDSAGRLRVIADLDVVNLSEKAEDSAHSSGDVGDYVLAVRADARPTGANVSADGDYASFFVNANGELYVKDTDAAALLTTIDADTSAIAVDIAAIETELLDQGTTLDSILSDTNAIVVDVAAIEAELLAQGLTLDSIESELQGLSHLEDAAHTSGDAGMMSLAVRNDTLASLVDTDGDYAPLQVDADGALYVNVASSGELTVNDAALANTAIASAANALGVANTAEDVVASPLANRKYLFIRNNGNRTAYIGASGVSASNGFPLSPGSVLEMRAGPSIDIEWVSSDTNQELRTLELS